MNMKDIKYSVKEIFSVKNWLKCLLAVVMLWGGVGSAWAQQYYEVKFVVDKTSDGGEVEVHSQLLRVVDANEKIGVMPQDPFYAGHTFLNWVDETLKEMGESTWQS